MRKLVHIPIVHDVVDLGSAATAVRLAYALEEWEKHVAAVQHFWMNLRGKVLALDLDYPRTKLYQDSCPLGGERALSLVEELARQGSNNYRLLLELIRRGATLVQTEDPGLLKAEYELLQKTKPGDEGVAHQAHAAPASGASAEVQLQREAFIIKQIDETLQEGETGLLFLGASHNLLGRLPATIKVSVLAAFP